MTTAEITEHTTWCDPDECDLTIGVHQTINHDVPTLDGGGRVVSVWLIEGPGAPPAAILCLGLERTSLDAEQADQLAAELGEHAAKLREIGA